MQRGRPERGPPAIFEGQIDMPIEHAITDRSLFDSCYGCNDRGARQRGAASTCGSFTRQILEAPSTEKAAAADPLELCVPQMFVAQVERAQVPLKIGKLDDGNRLA